MSTPNKTGPWTECPDCGGDSIQFECFDGFCEDAEWGCDDCLRDCELCNGAGGWPPDQADEEAA